MNLRRLILDQTLRPARLPAVDIARGVALIAMALYHFSWNLDHFGYLEPGASTSGTLKLFARSIATSFLFLTGVSLVLAARGGLRWQPFAKRLAMVCAGAAAVTLATWFATPQSYVSFGILHHIALASVIGLAFIRAPWFITAAAAIAAFLLPDFWPWPTQSPALAFIGLAETVPASNDFVPLLPWLSASLAGIALAKSVLPRIAIPECAKPVRAPGRALAFLGRHSLAFYLLHQPVLFGLVFAAASLAPPTPVAPEIRFARECRAACLSNFDAMACDTYCDCFLDRLNETGIGTDVLTIDPAVSRPIITACSARMRQEE
jgi:uncharacterized membrane protein